jgi:hypothetical protein
MERLVPRELLVQMEQTERPVSMVLLEKTAPLVWLEKMVPLGPSVQLERMVMMGMLVLAEKQVKLVSIHIIYLFVFDANWKKDPLDLLVVMVPTERMEESDPLDPKDMLARMVRKELLVKLDLKVP